MAKCPVCGKEYQNSLSLLKHIRLKSHYDNEHKAFWEEYLAFKAGLDDSYDELYTETDIFREFLRAKIGNGKFLKNGSG